MHVGSGAQGRAVGDKNQVSEMQNRLSVGVSRKAFAGCTRHGRSWLASSCSVNAEEHVLEVKKMENERKKAVVQLEEDDVAKQEEDRKMEVDEKTDSRETLEMRKWNVMKDMRKLERVK